MEEEEDYEEEVSHHVVHVHIDPLSLRLRGEEARVPPLSSPAAAAVQFADFLEEEESEGEDGAGQDVDDEEDEITDYLGGVVVVGGEVDSAQSSSPASQGRSGSVSSNHESTPTRDPDCTSLSDHAECLSGALGKMRVSEQDTISDESGYSEEPISSSSRAVTVVAVGENCDNDHVVGLVADSPPPPHQHTLNIKLNQAGGGGFGGQAADYPDGGYSSQGGGGPDSGGQDTGYSITVINNSRRSSSTTESVDSTPRGSMTDTLLTALADESPRSPSLSATPSPPPPPPPASANKTCSPPRVNDLSVKSVLLSEFSTVDKLKYIERSNLKASKPAALVLNRQEFCINI